MTSEVTQEAEKELKKLEIQEDVVDPWNVASASETGVDYDKLISTLIHFIEMNIAFKKYN